MRGVPRHCPAAQSLPYGNLGLEKEFPLISSASVNRPEQINRAGHGFMIEVPAVPDHRILPVAGCRKNHSAGNLINFKLPAPRSRFCILQGKRYRSAGRTG